MDSLVSFFRFGPHASWKVGDENRDISNIYGTVEIILSHLKMKELMTLSSISSLTKILTHLRKFQKHLITGEEKVDRLYLSF